MNVLEREQAQLARLRELRDQIVTALTGEAVEIDPDITFGELAAVLPEKIDEAIRQGTGGIRAREIVKEEELGLTDGGAATVGGLVQVGDSAAFNDEATAQIPHVHRQTIRDILRLTDAFYATVSDYVRVYSSAVLTDEATVRTPTVQRAATFKSAAVTDVAIISKPKNIMHDTQYLQGAVTVTLEDRFGNIKEQQTVNNVITEAFARIMLANTFNSHAGLKGLVKTDVSTASAGTTNICRVEQPGNYGIYLLNEIQNVTKDTYYPPYLLPNGNQIDFGKTTFYNDNGSTAAENIQTLVPVPSRCIFDVNTRMIQLEYVKNLGEGVVQNICVGRTPASVGITAATIAAHSFVQQRPFLPDTWRQGGTSTSYVIEHTATGWKNYRQSRVYSSNYQQTDQTMNGWDNQWLSGGLVSDGRIYSVKYLTATSITVYARPGSVELATTTQPETQYRCLNPMSVPAIWNKPRFYHPPAREFRLDPKLFSDYLVPHRVLIEGRVSASPRAPWMLMDEYTMDHFSTRAHVEFSYPREVLQIRITIQDWFGTTELIDCIEKDWFYANEAGTLTTDTARFVDPFQGNSIHTEDYNRYAKEEDKPSDRWVQAGSLWPTNEYRWGLDLTVGSILGNKLDRSERAAVAPTSQFHSAHRELAKWKARTIPSLWHSIYIPPFLFFAGEDDSVNASDDTRDASGPRRGAFTPVRNIIGIPEVLEWKPVLLEVSVSPATATNDVIQWTVPAHNASVEVLNKSNPATATKSTTTLSIRPDSLIRLEASNFPRWPGDSGNLGMDEFGNVIPGNHEAKLTYIRDNLKPLFEDITLRATVKNGLDYGVDFVKDFTLPVVLPLEITGTESGSNYILTWKVPVNSWHDGWYQQYQDVNYPYKGFLLECCRNEQFIYFEDCELYNNCTLGQDCPVYEQCGYWENRQQRALPDRKLARTIKTSTYARQEGQYLFVRVMAVAELPEMNSPWSETFIIPPR